MLCTMLGCSTGGDTRDQCNEVVPLPLRASTTTSMVRLILTGLVLPVLSSYPVVYCITVTYLNKILESLNFDHCMGVPIFREDRWVRRPCAI